MQQLLRMEEETRAAKMKVKGKGSKKKQLKGVKKVAAAEVLYDEQEELSEIEEFGLAPEKIIRENISVNFEEYV